MHLESDDMMNGLWLGQVDEFWAQIVNVALYTLTCTFKYYAVSTGDSIGKLGYDFGGYGTHAPPKMAWLYYAGVICYAIICLVRAALFSVGELVTVFTVYSSCSLSSSHKHSTIESLAISMPFFLI